MLEKPGGSGKSVACNAEDTKLGLPGQAKILDGAGPRR
jgi:hypothetical protein